MTWLSPWDVGVVDDPLRGLWGWFLDWLQPELRRLRRACLDAEPGAEADAAYDRLAEHYDLIEWAAKKVDEMYLADRWKVAVDWGWHRGETSEGPEAGAGAFDGGPDPLSDDPGGTLQMPTLRPDKAGGV